MFVLIGPHCCLSSFGSSSVISIPSDVSPPRSPPVPSLRRQVHFICEAVLKESCEGFEEQTHSVYLHVCFLVTFHLCLLGPLQRSVCLRSKLQPRKSYKKLSLLTQHSSGWQSWQTIYLLNKCVQEQRRRPGGCPQNQPRTPLRTVGLCWRHFYSKTPKLLNHRCLSVDWAAARRCYCLLTQRWSENIRYQYDLNNITWKSAFIKLWQQTTSKTQIKQIADELCLLERFYKVFLFI